MDVKWLQIYVNDTKSHSVILSIASSSRRFTDFPVCHRFFLDITWPGPWESRGYTWGTAVIKGLPMTTTCPVGHAGIVDSYRYCASMGTVYIERKTVVVSAVGMGGLTAA